MKIKLLTVGSLVMTAFCGICHAAAADHLVHQWTFNDGTANDSIGTAHGRLNGNVAIGNGALYLSKGDINYNSNYMVTSGLGGTLRDKTLIAWCALSDLDRDGTCAGSVLSITAGNRNDSRFDGIVFGERLERQWMSGSDWWRRTPPDNGGAEEDTSGPHEVMIAITYQSDPVQITLYRNGTLYGTHTQANDYGIPEYDGNAVALFGPRNASGGYISGHINEARIYDTALTAEEIAAIYAEGPVPSDVTSIWNGGFEAFSPWEAVTEEKQAGDMSLFPSGWYMPQETAALVANRAATRWYFYLASRWYYQDPTEGGTRLCIEVDKSWTLESKFWITSGPLGNMKAGETYQVEADFQTSIEGAKDTFPRMELIDLANGDILAVTEQPLSGLQGPRQANNTVPLVMVSPPVSSERAGHQLALRIMHSITGSENVDGWSSVRLGVDNVRLTLLDPAESPIQNATWINTDGGLFSESGNWQDGIIPNGIDRTVTVKASQDPCTTSIRIDRAFPVSNLIFQEGSDRQVWELNEETNGCITVNTSSGQPTIAVGSGLAVLSSLNAPKGFAKTGLGTLQIGAIRQLEGPLAIHEGRVIISDVLRHRWSFNNGVTDDLIGMAHGTLNNAIIENDQLVIPAQGGSFLTEEIMRPIKLKTLVVWTTLDNPMTSNKGSALTLFNGLNQLCNFDCIIYGECRDRCWMAGSDNWKRTQNPQEFGEPEAESEEVLVAISYYSVFSPFSAYISRNGSQYGVYDLYGTGLQTFEKDSRVLIGPRHYGNGDTYIGKVNEARIYRVPLSLEQLAELAEKGPDKGCAIGKVPPLPADMSVTMGPNGILDLDMTDQTIASLEGAGRVQNGDLHVSEAITLNGPLTFDSAFTLGENTTLTFTSFDACLTVEKGSLSFPEQGTVVVDIDTHQTPPAEGFTIFKSATAVNWDEALAGIDMPIPVFSRYQTTVVKTENTYGYTFRFIGGTILMVQ
ncbi:MAG: hypothetical protein J6U40_04765 [Kiritimatiellae bacterium]|nr:hypothetical protein [Kiritimatiellia bacterium]